MKITEIYETEAAKRFRLEYFPVMSLVNLRRSVIVESFNPIYYRNIKYYRVSEEWSGTGADQIIIFMPEERRKTTLRVEKSGYVIIDGLRIYEEVVFNGEQQT